MNKTREFFFHTYSHKIFFYLFFAVFIIQILFALKTENIKPKYNLLPNLPSLYLVRAASLGDDEFLFRILANRIQNAGDVFAGFVALKNYDYNKLYQWLTLLDTLNDNSNLTPALASYYFGQTQNKENSSYIIKYLDEHSSKNIDKNWWWIYQAIYLANNTLHDEKIALKLAYKLSENNAQNAPLWTKQMPAFIHAKYGDGCMAFKIIQDIINESNNGKRKLSVEEMNFMRYFINERLTKLQNKKFNPKSCKF